MRKLKTKGQMILYATAGLGINLLNTVMGSYLCSALLIGGFAEADIPFQTFAQKDLVIAGLWATFVLIAKILDGIIDIPMAAFTDKLRTKWGRRRPSLVIGLVPLILSYLLFLVHPNDGATLLNTIYFGVVLCVFYSFYTLTMVTYYATFTEIVETEEQRSFISNVKSVCDIVYFIIGFVAVRALLNGINVRPVALIVLPLACTMLIPLFMIKEPSNLEGEKVTVRTVGLFSSLRHTLRNRTYVIWMVVYFFMTFGLQLFLGGINEYFSFTGMNMIYIMMAAFAPVPLTLWLYNKIMRRWGFGVAFRYILIVFSVCMLGTFGASCLPDPAKNIAAVLGGVVCSFAIGALFAVAYSVPSQLAAEEEERTGISNSAMYFAVQGLFSGVASGIATGIVLVALKGTEENPSNGIFYMTPIAAVGTLAALVCTVFLPRSILKMGKKEQNKK